MITRTSAAAAALIGDAERRGRAAVESGRLPTHSGSTSGGQAFPIERTTKMDDGLDRVVRINADERILAQQQ
jgi:hypothetical protein